MVDAGSAATNKILWPGPARLGAFDLLHVSPTRPAPVLYRRWYDQVSRQVVTRASAWVSCGFISSSVATLHGCALRQPVLPDQLDGVQFCG